MQLPRVLVVDDSRVVRMSLIQHLKGYYEVREEGDGEAAWQTLVLDHAVCAVISDIQMPRLTGYDLLERLRGSKLPRLRQLPFILLSGGETEADRARALAMGVSDFVTKDAGASAVLARLNNLRELISVRGSLEAGREEMVRDPGSGLFTRRYVESQAAQALSHSVRHGVDVSFMVFGFDGYAAFCERLGEAAAEAISQRFARMLAGKMRQEDTLGHFGLGRFAVVSPGTAPAFCATFAERVRQAVEVARLSVQGENMELTVSIGLASAPADPPKSAPVLLDLAERRMAAAMAAGGNRIDAGDVLPATRPISIPHALELLAAERPAAVLPHLPSLVERLLPLMRLMNKELGLTLPLAEIERCMSGRNAKNN